MPDGVSGRWNLFDDDQFALVAVRVPRQAHRVDTCLEHEPHGLAGFHPNDVRDSGSPRRRDAHRVVGRVTGPDGLERQPGWEKNEEEDADDDPWPNAPPSLLRRRLGDEAALACPRGREAPRIALAEHLGC